jgi:hypothetical protein
VFNAPVYDNSDQPEVGKPALATMTGTILDFERAGIFKCLPGYERYYTPRSEYLFKSLQPAFDDILLLGRTYESLFDRFEVMWALAYADSRYKGPESRVWGPVGRFGWKHSGFRGPGPLSTLIIEAQAAGGDWAPFRAGFFQGSTERFMEISSAYAKQISGLGWF